MKTPTAWLVALWVDVRASYWFLPSCMAAAACLMAAVALEVDTRVGSDWTSSIPLLLVSDPDGARAVLATVAGSMITVAGVAFSITIVALTVASGQFGPRLLRNFMADRSSQLCLGAFVAIFLYCLLVLRTVRGPEEQSFVPSLAVALGVVLGVVGLGVLLYFLHHSAVSLQASNVVADVARDVEAQLDRCFPPPLRQGEGTRAREGPVDLPVKRVLVEADAAGYVRVLDHEALLAAAAERDVVVMVRRGPGAFVMPGAPLAEVGPADRVDDALVDRLRDAFAVGAQRTPHQDVAFSLQQLVEIAVRALSPGVNDPHTAVACIHRLGQAFTAIAGRADPEAVRRDDDGVARVLSVPAVTLELALREAFDAIRVHALASRDVSVALLETLTTMAEAVDAPERRLALGRYGERVRRDSRGELRLEDDRDRVDGAYRRLAEAVDREGGPEAG